MRPPCAARQYYKRWGAVIGSAPPYIRRIWLWHVRFTQWTGAVMVLLIIIAVLPLNVAAQASDPEAVVQAMIDALIAGDYEAAVAKFDDTMLSLMPADVTQQTWDSVLAQVGAYQMQLGVQSQQVEGYTIVVTTLQFEYVIIDMQVSVDTSGKIAGLYFRPSQAPQPAWEPPAYADPAAFTEQDITLNAGTDWALPGTLTVPVGDGPFPAVVLVHGSGPHDRDETIGPNKLFRDLAWGLATKASPCCVTTNERWCTVRQWLSSRG